MVARVQVIKTMPTSFDLHERSHAADQRFQISVQVWNWSDS